MRNPASPLKLPTAVDPGAVTPDVLEAAVQLVMAALTPLPAPAPAQDTGPAPMLTVKQTAALVGMSRMTVIRKADAGELPCVVVSQGKRQKMRRFPRAPIEELAARGGTTEQSDLKEYTARWLATLATPTVREYSSWTRRSASSRESWRPWTAASVPRAPHVRPNMPMSERTFSPDLPVIKRGDERRSKSQRSARGRCRRTAQAGGARTGPAGGSGGFAIMIGPLHCGPGPPRRRSAWPGPGAADCSVAQYYRATITS